MTTRENVTTDWITLGDGHRAYRATPRDSSGPRVLLLHAWWGLNRTFQRLADQLADSGFTVVAPDMYEGRVVATVEDAEREVNRVRACERMGAVDAALAYLHALDAERGAAIGVVGFSLGAYYALEVAAKDTAMRAVVLFYGTGQAHDWRESRASFLGHFAGNDPYEPTENVDALVRSVREADRSFELHRYAASGHWFMEPDRSAYDAEAAALAWERTIGFLRKAFAK